MNIHTNTLTQQYARSYVNIVAQKRAKKQKKNKQTNRNNMTMNDASE